MKTNKSIYPMDLGDKFRFGKYRGQTLDYVLANGVHYIEWCIDNVDDFELSNEAYEAYEIEQRNF